MQAKVLGCLESVLRHSTGLHETCLTVLGINVSVYSRKKRNKKEKTQNSVQVLILNW